MAEQKAGYPILLNLQDKQVAVVGGGRVAERKVKRLMEAGARILVISPAVSSDILALANAGEIEMIQEAYRRDMLNDSMPMLVIAASGDEQVNSIVAQDAHRIRALCNVVSDNGDASDFSNMALIHQPPLTIALSSGGSSPALLRVVKANLEAALGGEYALLSEWMGELRAPLKECMDSQADRQLLYQRILDSNVLPLLREGQAEPARRIFQQIVAEGTAQ